jgi:hypothetical protein
LCALCSCVVRICCVYFTVCIRQRGLHHIIRALFVPSELSIYEPARTFLQGRSVQVIAGVPFEFDATVLYRTDLSIRGHVRCRAQRLIMSPGLGTSPAAVLAVSTTEQRCYRPPGSQCCCRSSRSALFGSRRQRAHLLRARRHPPTVVRSSLAGVILRNHFESLQAVSLTG